MLIRQYRFTVIKLNKSKEDLEEAVLCQVRKMTDVLTEENAMRREMHKNGRKAVLETGKVYWAVKPNISTIDLLFNFRIRVLFLSFML